MMSLRERCIKLREIAEYLEDNERTQHIAPELRAAADTIWKLCCKLANNQSKEIELLKEQVRWLKKGDVLHVLTDQELADQQKHEQEIQASINALENENAKLRKLVCDMWQTISKDDGCDWDIDANCCTSDECNASCKYWYRMKELGIEVN